jgi:hypothetical protein
MKLYTSISLIKCRDVLCEKSDTKEDVVIIEKIIKNVLENKNLKYEELLERLTNIKYFYSLLI